MTKVFKEITYDQWVWHSDFTVDADHQSNAERSATVGIRKWIDYLKAEE